MALPKIQLPLFEIEVPSTKEKTKFRPFTVKEEKILLIAQESKDQNQIVLAIKQIINNCIEGIDVEKLATFDIEYLLLNIRAKSVNDILTFGTIDDETGEEVSIEVKVEDIKILTQPGHNKSIKLDDNYVMTMRYPTVDQINKLTSDKDVDRTEQLFDLMISCIDSIADIDTVYKMNDFTNKEVTDFIDSLSNTALKQIKEFFETMPILRYESEYTNKNGTKKKFVLEGTETFFMQA